MLKLSQLLKSQFKSSDMELTFYTDMELGHFTKDERHKMLLKIRNGFDEDVVAFPCPLCELNVIVLKFQDLEIYNCRFDEVEPNFPVICDDCAKLDLANLDSIWTRSQIPDKLLQRIKQNLQLMGEIQ